MLFAKSRTSLFSQETSTGGYSKPAPGPDILKMQELIEERIDGNRIDSWKEWNY
jgi:hypothetical protein